MTLLEQADGLDRRADELRKTASELSAAADRLRKASLDEKERAGTATRRDVEMVHGSDTCGYRW